MHAEAARQRFAAEARVIIDLWPCMSVREIAQELDVTMQAVHARAAKLGLVGRPGSARP